MRASPALGKWGTMLRTACEGSQQSGTAGGLWEPKVTSSWQPLRSHKEMTLPATSRSLEMGSSMAGPPDENKGQPTPWLRPCETLKRLWASDPQKPLDNERGLCYIKSVVKSHSNGQLGREGQSGEGRQPVILTVLSPNPQGGC